MTLVADQTFRAADYLAALRTRDPSKWYKPGRKYDLDGKPVDPLDNGQLQFHSAPHIYRVMAPGNGFGKTACLAVEIDWWAHRTHVYQAQAIPKRERVMLLLTRKFQQFEIMRPKLEMWWQPGWKWTGSPNFCYRWPGEAKLFVITSMTDWENIQGVEPDLVAIDENCPSKLWYELQRRRRAGTKTRYVLAATQTDGLSWVYRDLYLPWRRYHEDRGVTDEREMVRQQLHRFPGEDLADVPGIWCLPFGSERDNPTCTKQSWAETLQKTAGSAAEKAVRLYGGFRDFAGQPVFDTDNIEAMRSKAKPGRTGAFYFEEVKDGPA